MFSITAQKCAMLVWVLVMLIHACSLHLGSQVCCSLLELMQELEKFLWQALLQRLSPDQTTAQQAALTSEAPSLHVMCRMGAEC